MKGMVKRFLLSLCIFVLWGMTAQAVDGYTEFHIENQKGNAGDIVNVPVQFNSGQEVGGFQISIYYDKEVLEFQNLEKGNLIEENGTGIFDYNHIEENSEIVVVYAVADTVKDEGVIVNLQFRLKKDCPEKLPIGMESEQVVDNTEQSEELDGTVSGVDETFQEQIVGDAVQSSGNAENTENLETSEGSKSSKTSQSMEHSDNKRNVVEQKETDIGKGVIIAILIAVVGIAGGILWYCRKKKK